MYSKIKVTFSLSLSLSVFHIVLGNPFICPGCMHMELLNVYTSTPIVVNHEIKPQGSSGHGFDSTRLPLIGGHASSSAVESQER